MTTRIYTSRITHSLGRRIADALDETAWFQTKTFLRGAVQYGTHQTADDKTVIAYFDGMEFRYRVHHKSKTKGDYESGYSITREDGVERVGEHDLRGLPKSMREAASCIAWDCRHQVMRAREARSEIAKNIRAAMDRKTATN